MPTVTISQPAVINVKVGNKPATVQSITYGTRTLKSATDLTIAGANTTANLYITNSGTDGTIILTLSKVATYTTDPFTG